MKTVELTLNRTSVHPFTLLFFLFILIFVCSSAYSRSAVVPETSTPGSTEKYFLRIQNQRDVSTIGVELTFPEVLKVISFQDISGWKLTIHKDSTGVPIAAEWKGTLAPDKFVEFPFIAVNPDSEAVLKWPTTQEYAGGELVNWVGEDTSSTPTATTTVKRQAPIQEDTVRTANFSVPEENGEESCDWEDYAGWGALGISIVALILAIVKKRPTA